MHPAWKVAIASSCVTVAAVAYIVVGLLSANRDLSCSIAGLIAHVPAVQFENESIRNFQGWVYRRQQILVNIREGQSCDAKTIAALEERAEKDENVLERAKETVRNR